jgi:hypothetical protein
MLYACVANINVGLINLNSKLIKNSYYGIIFWQIRYSDKNDNYCI